VLPPPLHLWIESEKTDLKEKATERQREAGRLVHMYRMGSLEPSTFVDMLPSLSIFNFEIKGGKFDPFLIVVISLTEEKNELYANPTFGSVCVSVLVRVSADTSLSPFV
jgi:hypothetical protein